MSWRTVILPHLEQSNVRTLYDIQQHWWQGTNLAVASIPISIFLCPSTPEQALVLQATAKSPRPALTFSLPLARTDYEAIQGVQPNSIDPIRYDAGNRFSVMHRNSSTRHGAIHDGTSQTIMVVEAAGRPSVYRVGTHRPAMSNDQGIGWIDSEGAFSLDGSTPDGVREGCRPVNGCTVAINARNDNEPYSFHVGGMHALFADGHIIFVNRSISLHVMAALCTRAAADDTSNWEGESL
jgi:prepilin-type processing-associated H-X9-DG protein